LERKFNRLFFWGENKMLLGNLKLKGLSKLIQLNGKPPQPISILIVEDDELIQEQWLLSVKNRPNIIVETASGIRSALKQVEKSDILILDWKLGEQSGDTVLTRWLDFHAGNPCVVISGHITKTLKEQLLLSGVFNVYEKHLNLGVLNRTVGRYVREVQALNALKAQRVELASLRRNIFYLYCISLSLLMIFLASGNGTEVWELIKSILL
jgi:DNA-binding response OmpR family regulator